MINNFHDHHPKLRYFFSVLLVFCNFYLFGDQSVREILNTIPISEKENLERLFQDLFNRENFSYTLFGDKPMSLTDYSTTSFDSDGIPSKSGLRFRKRWEVWKKYAHAFPMTQLSFNRRSTRKKR